MKFLGKEQWITLFVAVLLLVPFFMADVSVLANNKAPKDIPKVEGQQNQSQEIDIDYLSNLSIQELDDKQVNHYTESLKKYSDAKTTETKVQQAKEIAEWWEKLQFFGTSGAWWSEAAKLQGKKEFWEKAGELSNRACRYVEAGDLKIAFAKNALHAFSELLKSEGNNLNYKVGMGIALVNIGQNPMQGIGLLREGISEDPKNYEANLYLGLFSMQTQQYEKAIQRFEIILPEAKNVDVYLYLGTAYQAAGRDKDALKIFKESRKLVGNNIAARKSIDELIDKIKF